MRQGGDGQDVECHGLDLHMQVYTIGDFVLLFSFNIL